MRSTLLPRNELFYPAVIGITLCGGLLSCKEKPQGGAAAGIKFVKAGHRAVGPSWKNAKPDPKNRIDIGTKIFISTNVYPDPFDGSLTIRPDGTILPKFCKLPVKIAGLSEEEASAAALDHVFSEGVYNPKSEISVSVVEAKRFNKK